MLFFRTTSSGKENNLLAPGARSLFQSTLAGNPETIITIIIIVYVMLHNDKKW